MSRYIDKDALGIGRANPEVFENKAYADGWNSAVDIILSAPAIDAEEDVVRVVRCKNCAYRDRVVDEFGVVRYFCGYFCGSQRTDPNGYCYRGMKL